ncbi:hypothetical protein FHETE_8042 [Fusarium heterosporum]|uniref:Uncharacterized protein n=1 Tax=Fusarium heterosporum TaxID=42747 RepID=A0A8H5T4L1_FUSHE|nr:hypothetical protein FHETE_8042 [Fusarium heterosporum]
MGKLPVGPFDGRKKRSRCLACAASHLKIRIGPIASDDKVVSPLVLGNLCKNKLHSSPRLALSPSAGQIYYLTQYFDTFLQHNNFSPGSQSFTDVIRLMKDSDMGTFLHDAVLSLGAMQAVKLNSSEGVAPSKAYGLAVHHYSKSVLGLRNALGNFEQVPSTRHRILWTTHFLGLFELMNDSTGQGWIQHLVHGTSRALVAAGPASCYSGPDQRFFTEIKVFEVCRAIIFNEPTFLAEAEWRELVGKMKTSRNKDVVHSLDELLDIIVLCSTLRVRAERLIYPETVDSRLSGQQLDEAYDIAQQGFLLRQNLIDWEAREKSPNRQEDGRESAVSGGFACLARSFFSATSIYLSGVFDYEITHWQKIGIVAPNLSEEEIQMHVATILTQTERVIHGSAISSLLVLFPLRVAGARSWESWQQDLIMQNLTTVERMFPVAAAFKEDLYGVWSRRASPGVG